MNHQNPIELDVSLKYKCSNIDCNISHWLFLREAKAKNFKVVCDCGTTFKPKRIKKIKIVYDRPVAVTNKVDKSIDFTKLSDSDPILKRAMGIMKSLGYSEKESLSYINAVYALNKYDDPKILVKNAISNFGVNNE